MGNAGIKPDVKKQETAFGIPNHIRCAGIKIAMQKKSGAEAYDFSISFGSGCTLQVQRSRAESSSRFTGAFRFHPG